MKTSLFAALSLLACTAWAQEPTVAVDPPAAKAAPAVRFGTLTQGEAVPDFTVVGEKGVNTQLSAFKGRTVVVHFFKGTQPQPYLQKIAKTYGKSVTVLAVKVAAERADFDAWVAGGKSEVTYPVAWDPAGTNRSESVAQQQMGIGMFPATVVVDASGKLVDGTIGFGEAAESTVYFALDRAGVPLLAADKPKAAPPGAVNAAASAPKPAGKPLLAAGEAAPDFVMQDIEGKDVRLSDFKGKVVVLDFWASWCGPCKAAMPGLQKIHEATEGQGVVVLASCTADTREAYEKYVNANSEKFTFLFAHDAQGKSPESASKTLYGVRGIPTQFVIGRDGVILSVSVGANEKKMAATLAQAGIDVSALEAEQTAQTDGG